MKITNLLAVSLIVALPAAAIAEATASSMAVTFSPGANGSMNTNDMNMSGISSLAISSAGGHTAVASAVAANGASSATAAATMDRNAPMTAVTAWNDESQAYETVISYGGDIKISEMLENPFETRVMMDN